MKKKIVRTVALDEAIEQFANMSKENRRIVEKTLNEINQIFLVATYENLDDLRSGRTVGYFTTKKKAAACVKHNLGDIYEGCYKYAVIEQVKPGLYQYDMNPTFFEWKNGGYVKIKRPQKWEGICGFTIG